MAPSRALTSTASTTASRALPPSGARAMQSCHCKARAAVSAAEAWVILRFLRLSLGKNWMENMDDVDEMDGHLGWNMLEMDEM